VGINSNLRGRKDPTSQVDFERLTAAAGFLGSFLRGFLSLLSCLLYFLGHGVLLVFAQNLKSNTQRNRRVLTASIARF